MAGDVKVHPAALCESDRVGAGTRIWAFAHVLHGAIIGRNCNIGDHCFVEGGAVLGDNITLKNGVAVWAGVHLEDGVFVGPVVAFTNDKHPRSPRLPVAKARYATPAWLSPTRVREGASLGANATIVCGITIGRYAVVAAGAVVTADVPDFALVAGCPARPVGFACACGRPLPRNAKLVCATCGRTYARRGEGLVSRKIRNPKASVTE